MPHHQASVQPFLPPTSSSSPHFPPVHPSQSSDLAVPAAAGPPPSTVAGPLSSSQESSSHGNAACLPSETSCADSVRTRHAHGCTRGCAVVESGVAAPRQQSSLLLGCARWRPAGLTATEGPGRASSPCASEQKSRFLFRPARSLLFHTWASGHLRAVSCGKDKIGNWLRV